MTLFAVHDTAAAETLFAVHGVTTMAETLFAVHEITVTETLFATVDVFTVGAAPAYLLDFSDSVQSMYLGAI